MAATFRNFDRDEKTLPRLIDSRSLRGERTSPMQEERMAALNIPESDREMLRWPFNRIHSGQAAAYREWDARVRYTDEEFQQWLGEKGRAHLEKLDRKPTRPRVMANLRGNLHARAWPHQTIVLLARGEVTKKAEPLDRFLSALTPEHAPKDTGNR